jgi:hypothetical protein
MTDAVIYFFAAVGMLTSLVAVVVVFLCCTGFIELGWETRNHYDPD